MERVDDLQYEGLKLIQDDEQFRFGCDAVELANFTEGSVRDRACDLGCGNGIIPVLLAKKRGMSVVGVEIQSAAAALARRNAKLNNLEGLIEVYEGRMQDFAAEARDGSFSVVTCNPPYRVLGSGMTQEGRAEAVARHELAVTLSEAVGCAARLLKFGGKFFTVGQCQRLAETLSLCHAARLTPKKLQILRPCENKPPHLFLLKCVRGGRDGLEVLSERSVRSYGM